MLSKDQETVAERARKIYEDRLRTALEDSHRDQFVAIEPTSGEYFMGRTLSEAITGARQKHPNRLVHTLRIGHHATVHFG